jgi:hypothetical protein
MERAGVDIRVTKYCCEMMESNVTNACEMHMVRGGFGLIIHNDGGGSVIQISFCPWCGTRLPEIAPWSLDPVSDETASEL